MRMPRVPKGCLQVGARDRRGSGSIAMDSTTFVCGEHGELSQFFVPQSLVPCIKNLCGFRGQRVGGRRRRDCGRFNGPWTATRSQRTSVGTSPEDWSLKVLHNHPRQCRFPAHQVRSSER